MLAEFSVAPLGMGAHLGREIAKAAKILQESGLDYQMTAMGTLIEGSREEVVKVILKAHETLLKDNERVYTRIVLDELRKDVPGRIRSKVASVEKELGVPLKK